jgi:peptidoglycan/xylan/chitin deacetylase (PgdA/CDA1 family)
VGCGGGGDDHFHRAQQPSSLALDNIEQTAGALIVRHFGHAGRLAAAALAGAVLVGGGGLALREHPWVAGVPTGMMTTPVAQHATPTAPQASPSAQPTTAPAATAVAVDPEFGTPRVAPHLDVVEPKTSGIPVSAAIVVTFSQPMDRASVEASLSIQPTVEGSVVWLDDFTLRFEPYRLAYATTYQVQVRGRSVRGVPLVGPRWWSFTTVSGPTDVIPAGGGAIKVPILTYHYIRTNPNRGDRLGFALSVTPADFAAQMDWLARNNYHTITTEDLYAYLQGTRGLPSRPVILTFDDGYADFYTTALPILRSHDFRAVAYIVSSFVGQSGYMTAAQVREADRSGMEIGSHSVTHPDLARMSMSAVRSQLEGSKQFLEWLLGHPVVSFCYPSGKVNSAVAAQVAATGYHDATTTRFGYWHTLADRYVWTRLRVSGGEPIDQFAAAVLGAS